MLEFRIFKYPMFALSSAISIVISVAMFSAMILMPIYVQTIRGISPMDSGLLIFAWCHCDGHYVSDYREAL